MKEEDGTLKLVLSNSIPRDTVVLGKYLGGMLSLFPIVVVSLIVALLLALSSPDIAFNWKRHCTRCPDIRRFAVVRVNVVSFRTALICLDEGSNDDINSFDVSLGDPDKCSCERGDICGDEIFAT